MTDTIQTYLMELEKTKQIKILHACEAGSRAWNLASPSSDYDLRFIFLYPKETYLQIDPITTDNKRAVFEDKVPTSLDVIGFELTRALQLFRKSNPTILEWLHGPIIYHQATTAIANMKKITPDVWNRKATILHYVNMARKNLQKDTSDVKTFINIIRPILLAKWIKSNNSYPPFDFNLLVDTLLPPGNLHATICQLALAKKGGKKDFQLNCDEMLYFSHSEMHRLNEHAKSLTPAKKQPTPMLNQLFRNTLTEAWK